MSFGYSLTDVLMGYLETTPAAPLAPVVAPAVDMAVAAATPYVNSTLESLAANGICQAVYAAAPTVINTTAQLLADAPLALVNTTAQLLADAPVALANTTAQVVTESLINGTQVAVGGTAVVGVVALEETARRGYLTSAYNYFFGKSKAQAKPEVQAPVDFQSLVNPMNEMHVATIETMFRPAVFAALKQTPELVALLKEKGQKSLNAMKDTAELKALCMNWLSPEMRNAQTAWDNAQTAFAKMPKEAQARVSGFTEAAFNRFVTAINNNDGKTGQKYYQTLPTSSRLNAFLKQVEERAAAEVLAVEATKANKPK